ncbi:hypothetical protein KKC67_02135 [Patescibacteria group bacterium]|nr:hypothetical protein [Patescibacteria group bacterium]MBU0879731.1 hypothetical protein [Patescibacteria group bacterium]MBU0898042.1 hypothetical protein [Patescibacteria group bacterium]MBU1991794.1 hypothetical protein [Patescibacteria group bacterium]
MEKTFVAIFILAVLAYSLLSIGIFLFICKLILLATSQINIMGLTIS